MRLSCLPVSFFQDLIQGRMSIYAWAAMAARHKLDAVDLSILFLPRRSRAEAAQARTQVEDAGLRVAMLTTYPDFTHPNAAERSNELEHAIQSVELAAELGAALIRVTAGQAHPATSRENGVQWAIEGLNQLAHATKGIDVTLVIENHAKPGAWTYTDFSQPPDIFLEIVAGTQASGIGVNFDTGNAAAFADSPHQLLAQVMERVVSVHASDTAVRGRLEHVLLGKGITPFKTFFEQLHLAGWDNWICIEEASHRGEAGVAETAEFIRRTWYSAGKVKNPDS